MKTIATKGSNYQTLVKNILKNMQNISEEINRKKLEMCWNIGRLVGDYLEQNKDETHGNGLISRLEDDTKISAKELYKMRSFYQAYPKLPSKNNPLKYSHYRVLSGITDVERRKEFEKLAKQKNWSSDALQQQVSSIKKIDLVKNSTKKIKLPVTRGQLFTYKIAEIDGEKFLDLGFNIFEEFKGQFNKGEIVESFISNGSNQNQTGSIVQNAIARLDVNSAKTDKFTFEKTTIPKKQMHTYKASLEKIVDGDTIRVALDLGFGIRHKQILRLAKINAPEKGTKEGETATKKLREILSGVKNLIIKTNKSDIYGRYVGDIFLETPNGPYLSQMLLDGGVVVPY